MQSASIHSAVVSLRHWQQLTRDSTRIALLQLAMGREAADAIRDGFSATTVGEVPAKAHCRICWAGKTEANCQQVSSESVPKCLAVRRTIGNGQDHVGTLNRG